MNTQSPLERLTSIGSSHARSLNVRNRYLCALKIPNLPHRVGNVFSHYVLNDYAFIQTWFTGWYPRGHKEDHFIYSTNGQFNPRYTNDVPVWISPGYRVLTSFPFVKPEMTESGRVYIKSKEEKPRIIEEKIYCRPLLSEDTLKELFVEKLTV